MGYQLPVTGFTYQNYAARMHQKNVYFKTFPTYPVRFHFIGGDNNQRPFPTNKTYLDADISIVHLTVSEKVELTGKGGQINWQI
jgi:hypothetical protein